MEKYLENCKMHLYGTVQQKYNIMEEYLSHIRKQETWSPIA